MITAHLKEGHKCRISSGITSLCNTIIAAFFKKVCFSMRMIVVKRWKQLVLEPKEYQNSDEWLRVNYSDILQGLDFRIFYIVLFNPIHGLTSWFAILVIKLAQWVERTIYIIDYRSFTLLRDRQKRVSKLCYDLFIENAEKNIKRNSKFFKTYVKSKKNLIVCPKICSCIMSALVMVP